MGTGWGKRNFMPFESLFPNPCYPRNPRLSFLLSGLLCASVVKIPSYSYRKASIGSSIEAFRAG